jgi:hypothetical protein
MITAAVQSAGIFKYIIFDCHHPAGDHLFGDQFAE